MGCLLLSVIWALPLAGAPVKLIIDTDYDSDVDDVGSLALAHAYADRGEAEILGVAVVGLIATSAPAVHAQNAHHGRPEIPVGVRRGKGPPSSSSYTAMIVEKFPAAFDQEKAEDSVTLYRRLLARAEDRSVVIVSLGHLTNLADLLDTPADGFSPLTGVDLVKQKLIRYVCMGSEYPKQLKPGAWGNFLPDPKAVIRVNDGWPTPVLYTGGGEFARQVNTGKILSALPQGTLTGDAYRIFFEKTTWAKPPDHHSADLISIHVAVRGVGPFFRETKGGYCHVFENGTIEWRDSPTNPDRSYVADFSGEGQADAAAKEFGELITVAEQKRTEKR